MTWKRRVVAPLVLALALLASAPAGAVEADEILADPALEARARAISTTLRCLVCQNESIDDSSAGLARDLRLLVREQLTAGASDAEVYDFVTARYGDFVLLKPRFSPGTWLLWLGPFALLTGAIAWLWRAPKAAAVPDNADASALSHLERARLDNLLRDPTPGGEAAGDSAD